MTLEHDMDIPLDQILIQTINGVVTGMILSLVASGLTLIFGIMYVVNFAHGELLMLGAYVGVVTLSLTGNFWLLQILGAVMTSYGIYVCYLMLRRPEELAIEENHVSWAHMYRMMFVAQIGFAVAYLL